MFRKFELKNGNKLYINEASVAYVRLSRTADDETRVSIHFGNDDYYAVYGEDVEIVRQWAENLSSTVTDELS